MKALKLEKVTIEAVTFFNLISRMLVSQTKFFKAFTNLIHGFVYFGLCEVLETT